MNNIRSRAEEIVFRELIYAISKGKLHLVTTVASTVFNKGTEPRITDTLRNRKNYLIILNTLLRKAAEMSGVHPLHIDKIPSDFARQIEGIPSIRQSLSLQEKNDPGVLLVGKEVFSEKYSYYVGRTITLARYDLTADLSLKSVSAQLGVNPNYFATLFRKECCCTLTEYVNEQRIDRAFALLKKTGKPVQEIASECGFSDASYFIRLFKRRTGLTPNQYRRQQKG